MGKPLLTYLPRWHHVSFLGNRDNSNTLVDLPRYVCYFVPSVTWKAIPKNVNSNHVVDIFKNNVVKAL